MSFALIVTLWLMLRPACAEGPQLPSLFNSFESQQDLLAATTHHSRIAQQSKHATDGRHALRIEFEPAQWPNLAFRAPAGSWDWTSVSALAIDITNPTDKVIAFSIRIDDDPRADGNLHCRTGSGHAEPGNGPTTYVLSLDSAEAMAFGMRGLPSYSGTMMEAHGKIDTSHITQFQIFLAQPEVLTPLVIDRSRLLPAPALTGIVDRFGQYTGSDWPGKLDSEAELSQRLVSERAAMAQAPRLPDRDVYGGWESGPGLDATGFFRTEKHNGKWWLVTPEGRLFFSLGIDCVGTQNPTIIEQRESMFTWLPATDDVFAAYYGTFRSVHRGPVSAGQTFDFFRANLHRKYGKDFSAAWTTHTADRLQAWGFNTIGNWSDWASFELMKMPYTVPLQVGGDHARLSSGSDYWALMHDPFDPQFAADAEKSFQAAKRFRDDPWCLGYFVDNELSWGSGTRDQSRFGLAVHALAADAGQPAKAAFVQALQERYRTIEKFNAGWQTDLANWDVLSNESFSMPESFTAAMRDDCAQFTEQFARQYFSIVRDTLAKQDPNHLYLGCRFSSYTPESVAAAVEVCPVLSFNIYDSSVAKPRWDFTRDLDKPCLIGEFHFGALDRGMFHTGLVAAADQSSRAAAYQSYVRAVVDHPTFVGCHWFQLLDQPLTGRVYDGENYNIGFLNATDTPYPEMVEAAKAVHAEAYRRRAGEDGR